MHKPNKCINRTLKQGPFRFPDRKGQIRTYFSMQVIQDRNVPVQPAAQEVI
ncbi:hypothetical protein LguiB_028084 [Lonicera macranthoides]